MLFRSLARPGGNVTGLSTLSPELSGKRLELLNEIVPAPPECATEPATGHAQGQGETPRMNWARLLKRVFDIDIEYCPNCGGALKIIAAIEDPPVIVKILSHLGLATRAPPRAPARRVDLFQTI